CKLAQGYVITRPMPDIDIPEWISSWKVNDTWKTFELNCG
ncbi:MAG: EAL domain-containing protein (putative c-di-GMP-specific phosphodiesterase class I), partial [Candidatus Azotimanducaceae bacterium]